MAPGPEGGGGAPGAPGGGGGGGGRVPMGGGGGGGGGAATGGGGGGGGGRSSRVAETTPEINMNKSLDIKNTTPQWQLACKSAGLYKNISNLSSIYQYQLFTLSWIQFTSGKIGLLRGTQQSS